MVCWLPYDHHGKMQSLADLDVQGQVQMQCLLGAYIAQAVIVL